MFPSNENNSCFLDSVLVALFQSPRINEIEIEDLELHAIRAYIITEEEVSEEKKLNRRCLQSHVKTLRKNMGFDAMRQEDASEAMYRIQRMLGFDKLNITLSNVYGTNDTVNAIPSLVDLKLTSTREETSGVVHHIPSWTETSKISSLMSSMLDSGVLDKPYTSKEVQYSRTFTRSTLIPRFFLLVLHVDRTLTTTGINRTPVLVTRRLDASGFRFELRSVVLHSGKNIGGGHYTTIIFKSDNLVVFYDDTREHGIKYEDCDFETAVKKFNICEKGVLFFYSK